MTERRHHDCSRDRVNVFELLAGGRDLYMLLRDPTPRSPRRQSDEWVQGILTMLRVVGCLFGAFCIPAMAQAQPMTVARAAAIDQAVYSGMARVGAKGLALAVIEDGEVVLIRTYGSRNVAGDALEADTIMYGASITKAVFAYTVMRLADEGKLKLDEPISAMLTKPLPEYGNLDEYGNWGDLAGDERWRKLTPRILLEHASGFANFSFVEPDAKLRIHFEPGTRYAYSGEGLILLQFALEQRLRHSFEVEAQRLTFRPLGMKDSSLHWQDRFSGRLADGWQTDGRAVLHDRRDHVRVAGSMDTTIADLARFAAALVNGTGLSRASHEAMLAPQLRITTASEFPTLQPELPKSKQIPHLAVGLGVLTFDGPQGQGFQKGGHDDQTGNSMICLRGGRRCLVMLGNDVRDEQLYPKLARVVLGQTAFPWSWLYPDQKK